jgi:hypothetical protein
MGVEPSLLENRSPDSRDSAQFNNQRSLIIGQASVSWDAGSDNGSLDFLRPFLSPRRNVKKSFPGG